MTTDQIAVKLKVSARRVLQFIDEGRLPSAKQFGGVWIVDSGDVKNFKYCKRGRPKKKK